jgi:EmrB/QacA subfamily drug resistance transporter
MTAPTASSGRPAPGPTGASPRALWTALAVVMVGTVMVVLDTTIVNVALPQIAEALGAGEGIEWVVSAYLLAVAVSLPATGWIANRFGPKRVYLWSLGIFTAASVLCALSPTLPFLIGARVLQGLGGGAMMPVAMTIVLKIFPKEQHGRAMGAWGIAAMAAPAIGPTLGGWLVTSVDWHWLFLINLPIGLVALLAGRRLLPDIPSAEVGRFDVVGFLTGSIGLALLVFGLSEANNWGWTSTVTVLCIGGGAILLVAMVAHELRIPSPMLDVRMFRNRTFSLTFVISGLVVAAQYARLVYLPLYLEGERGYSALAIGLMLFPAGIVSAVAMHLGGALSDRIGPRSPIVGGTLVGSCAVLCVASFGLGAPLWLLAGLLSLQGFGMGLHTAPSTVMAMDTLTDDLVSQGSAMRALSAQVAGALAIATLGAVLGIALPDDATPAEARTAFDLVFYIAFAGLVAAFFLSLLLKRDVVVHDAEHDEAGMRERPTFALIE